MTSKTTSRTNSRKISRTASRTTSRTTPRRRPGRCPRRRRKRRRLGRPPVRLHERPHGRRPYARDACVCGAHADVLRVRRRHIAWRIRGQIWCCENQVKWLNNAIALKSCRQNKGGRLSMKGRFVDERICRWVRWYGNKNASIYRNDGTAKPLPTFALPASYPR